tara:strand:- start:199 stop:477 length:279 start_codon:yes stop_codon:yes gene_type:complete
LNDSAAGCGNVVCVASGNVGVFLPALIVAQSCGGKAKLFPELSDMLIERGPADSQFFGKFILFSVRRKPQPLGTNEESQDKGARLHLGCPCS